MSTREEADRVVSCDSDDDTHRYLFTLLTRCNRRITGGHSTMFVQRCVLYGVRGWYDIRRTHIREKGWDNFS